MSVFQFYFYISVYFLGEMGDKGQKGSIGRHGKIGPIGSKGIYFFQNILHFNSSRLESQWNIIWIVLRLPKNNNFNKIVCHDWWNDQPVNVKFPSHMLGNFGKTEKMLPVAL